jgi:hypothetical protein
MRRNQVVNKQDCKSKGRRLVACRALWQKQRRASEKKKKNFCVSSFFPLLPALLRSFIDIQITDLRNVDIQYDDI